MPASQANREASVTSALADDVLLFYRMTGTEQLGRLSEYRVQLMSATDDIKIADVLGTTMAVHVDLADGSTRYFNGIVTRFCSTGWNGSFATYEAIIHPWLWLLTRSSNCRIFQDMTAIDIVKAVTGDAMYGGLVNLDTSLLSTTCEARTYCVQYRETDFNFVCRLLEEEGIYYYFSHEEAKHTMVLADSYGAHDTIAGYDAVIFRGEGSREEGDEAVTHWSAGGEIQSSVYVLNDFDFEKAASSTSGGLLVKATVAAAFSQASYEMFNYPGGYVKAATGTTLARGRMEAIHGQCEQIEAKTTARGLYPGGLFGLTEHPREDQNRDYLVTGAQYEITGDDYSSESTTAGELLFNCAFTAVGKEHAYRAPPIMRKPFVQGPQTAMVVGKAGEEIWTDKYGRVKVQFHWDRLGKEDETSSCWVRVSQSWAGKGWGAMFIPRIGMEVVVDFLEGDPDQPLITGCVYNGDAMPPYALPAEQTKSTIKTNTSKGGGGFNEIRFEDKKDSEEIFVQAEKDFNRVVKNNDTLAVGFEKADKGDQTITINHDQSLDVGNDRTVHVVNDQTTNIDHDQVITVKNDQSVDIGNDQTESVGNNMTVKVTKNHALSVGGDQTEKVDGDQSVDVGKTCVIEAATSITLKVGGSSIKIEAAKITIKSTEIAISSDANMKVEAGAMMTTKSGAVMTIQGALVKIN
jgi:type VI secretion system secreted protein VgrG